jgi:hypothetical protein
MALPNRDSLHSQAASLCESTPPHLRMPEIGAAVPSQCEMHLKNPTVVRLKNCIV